MILVSLFMFLFSCGLMNMEIPEVEKYTYEVQESMSVHTGYIFLGDSRTVGMDNACSVSDKESEFVVAKVGKGYNWYEDTARSEIDVIVDENQDITKWVIISNLGVNDLGNVDKYVSAYNDLIDDGFELYLVSVNPVCEDYEYLTDDIELFNQIISGVVDEDHWIDTYDMLVSDGFSSSDGLHYSCSTYEKIYNKIEKEIL